MSNVLVNETSLENIAKAIREKNGLTTKYTPSEMTDAIKALSNIDTSDTTAVEANVLSGKIFHLKDGSSATGTMADNGKVTKSLNTTDSSYKIPIGYHNGTGTVSVDAEKKDGYARPYPYSIKGTDGKFLTQVDMQPVKISLPDGSQMLDSASISIDLGGGFSQRVDGTIETLSNITAFIGYGDTYKIPIGYHDGTGTVSNSISSVTQATPSLTFDTTSNKIVASSTQSSGYITTTDTKTASKSPSELDSNFIASNIKYGKTILGTEGTFTKNGTQTSGKTLATSAELLSGYSAWANGSEVIGSMPNKGAGGGSVGYGGEYTIEKGYYNGTGKVTNGITAGSVKASDSVAVNSKSFTYNTSTKVFDLKENLTIGKPSVQTSGYLSNTVGTLSTNTASSTTGVNVVNIKSENKMESGNAVVTPKISVVSKPSSDTWTDASSGSATTTKPTSGVYVEVKSAEDKNTLVSTPSVSSDGYGTTSIYTTSSKGETTVGANASDATYIPIKTVQPSYIKIGYGGEYTIPEGYHFGSGKVTNSVSAGTITSGSATITSLTPEYNSTNANFVFKGSSTVSAPTINTEGYVGSSVGTKNTNSANVSAPISKVSIKSSNTGKTSAVTPIISKLNKESGDTWVDGSNGSATTTKPTSGVYVKVGSAKDTGTLTSTPSIVTTGYGTADRTIGDTTVKGTYTSTSSQSTVGANASADTYVPIKTATQATPSITIDKSGKITASATQSDGYVSSGSKSSTAQITSAYDSNFVANNIKKDITIFGVTGTYEAVAPTTIDAVNVNYDNSESGLASRNAQGGMDEIASNMKSLFNYNSSTKTLTITPII